MLANAERCHICGKTMREFKGVYLCLPCNEKYGDYYNFFTSASKEYHDSNDHIVIECPGATIYDETNSRVVQGVKWHNDKDHSQGYEIVGKQVLSPNHKRTRRVPKDRAHNISRCQACQDFTVRMRIYNQQKDKEDYQQNSPMMPRSKDSFDRMQF
jgi:hypothetical protein